VFFFLSHVYVISVVTKILICTMDFP